VIVLAMLLVMLLVIGTPFNGILSFSFAFACYTLYTVLEKVMLNRMSWVMHDASNFRFCLHLHAIYFTYSIESQKVRKSTS
jgi:hypothetical protein